MSTLPASVSITDDTMREGLQIESAKIPVDAKLRLLDALGDTGAKVISIGSFAHPKWTPQMACIDEIAERFQPKPGVKYTAAVFNKAGYHYPQQRIIALWEDALPTIEKRKAPEPLVMRLNTFDCAMYQHTNLVPEVFELDDYQVRTPTDIIGQHIHLPKWDLTTTDGAANGWNYEDGKLKPTDRL